VVETLAVMEQFNTRSLAWAKILWAEWGKLFSWNWICWAIWI